MRKETTLILILNIFHKALFFSLFFLQFSLKGIAQKKETTTNYTFSTNDSQSSSSFLSFSYHFDSVRYVNLKTEFDKINNQIIFELDKLKQESKKDNFETTQEYIKRIEKSKFEIIQKKEPRLSQISDELKRINSKFYRYKNIENCKIVLDPERYIADINFWKGEVYFKSLIETLMLFLPTKAAKNLWNERDSIKIFSIRKIDREIPDTFLLTHNTDNTDAILLTYDKNLPIYSGRLLEEFNQLPDTLKSSYHNKFTEKKNVATLKGISSLNSTYSYNEEDNYDSRYGVSISRGLQGRKINRSPSFEDDFSENAKVAVDIKVDNNGNVTRATIQPRGTTTANANIKNIALKKARELKFTENEDGSNEQMGTIIFSFRIKQ